MISLEEKITLLDRALQEYLQTNDFTLSEVSTGRTNLNYFLDVSGKHYFLRTNILKVPEEALFGGKLEKEYQILTNLGNLGISAKPYHFHKDADIQFLIMERLDGVPPESFESDQDTVIHTLRSLQHIDTSLFPFLEKQTLRVDFERKITDRVRVIRDTELRGILEKIVSKVSLLGEEIGDEFCICHNDFRADNILVSIKKDRAWVIDVEGFIIADRYIDMAEYYVGGIFWNTFRDRERFDYTEYSQFLNLHGYNDSKKQLYIYLIQYCSYLSWIAAHVTTSESPLSIYVDTLERNRKKYYRDMETFIDNL